jgi:predicted NUDIX family NTP pyrophosphohydrolase
MPARRSAGILLFRRTDPGPAAVAPTAAVQVLIGHMGGPLWARKDEAAWSIPKGEYSEGESPFDAARREFREELGSPAPDVRYRELGEVTQSGGKVVAVWAGESDFDAASAVSETFEMEWPPRSGRMQSFPEIDRAQWFDLGAAEPKLVKGQRAFLQRLRDLLAG